MYTEGLAHACAHMPSPRYFSPAETELEVFVDTAHSAPRTLHRAAPTRHTPTPAHRVPVRTHGGRARINKLCVCVSRIAEPAVLYTPCTFKAVRVITILYAPCRVRARAREREKHCRRVVCTVLRYRWFSWVGSGALGWQHAWHACTEIVSRMARTSPRPTPTSAHWSLLRVCFVRGASTFMHSKAHAGDVALNRINYKRKNTFNAPQTNYRSLNATQKNIGIGFW